MSLGLCIQLLIWSSNREARCEHAAASRAEHICGLCRSASTLPPSSTRPHLLPGLAIRTVRNHVIVAFAICKIIEIEYEGAGYYKSNITNWKKIIKDEFSNTKGISIKYYGYNEMAMLTLVNKDLFPIHNNRRR